jgi:hypothetical protein
MTTCERIRSGHVVNGDRVNMMSSVYIFGYQSILADGSLATSVADCDGRLVPARLKGYIRGWSAVRTFETSETKRYVYAKDWHIAERVAFATLIQSSKKSVNGVCRRIPSDRLGALDFREQGYTRIEVSQDVEPYEGYELDRSIQARCKFHRRSSEVVPLGGTEWRLG